MRLFLTVFCSMICQMTQLRQNKSLKFLIFQKSDVSSTLDLLKRCSPFYHSGELTADCLNNPRPCIRVPRECILHNAVFTILHYLTDHDFMSTENVSKFPGFFSSRLTLQLGSSSNSLNFFKQFHLGSFTAAGWLPF